MSKTPDVVSIATGRRKRQPASLRTKDFLSVLDLRPAEFDRVLELAASMKRSRAAGQPALDFLAQGIAALPKGIGGDPGDFGICLGFGELRFDVRSFSETASRFVLSRGNRPPGCIELLPRALEIQWSEFIGTRLDRAANSQFRGGYDGSRRVRERVRQCRTAAACKQSNSQVPARQ